MADTRPRNRLRHIAERAAEHPRLEQAVIGAIRGMLPQVLETLIAEEADRHGSHMLRLYGCRRPIEQRQDRDRRILALLRSGMAPEHVALEVGCSRSHVYIVRRRACV